jgi:hypothetical protein
LKQGIKKPAAVSRDGLFKQVCTVSRRAKSGLILLGLFRRVRQRVAAL